VWDPTFFGLIRDPRASFRFDFATYRALNEAARRAFLLLAAHSHRGRPAPTFDLRGLAVDGLGYAEHEIKILRQKLGPVLRELADRGVIRAATDPEEFYARRGPGRWDIRLPRGPRLRGLVAAGKPAAEIADHHAYGLLKRSGLPGDEIARAFADHHPTALIRIARLTFAALSQGRCKGPARRYFESHLRRGPSLPWWYTEVIRKAQFVDRTFITLDRDEYSDRVEYEYERLDAFADWPLREPSVAERCRILRATFREYERRIFPTARAWDIAMQVDRLVHQVQEVDLPFPEFGPWRAARAAGGHGPRDRA
jgi:hypothetical protein